MKIATQRICKRVLIKDDKEYKSASIFVINRLEQLVSSYNNPKLSNLCSLWLSFWPILTSHPGLGYRWRCFGFEAHPGQDFYHPFEVEHDGCEKSLDRKLHLSEIATAA